MKFWPARLHRLAESTPRKSITRNRFLGSLNVHKFGLWLLHCSVNQYSRPTGRFDEFDFSKESHRSERVDIIAAPPLPPLPQPHRKGRRTSELTWSKCWNGMNDLFLGWVKWWIYKQTLNEIGWWVVRESDCYASSATVLSSISPSYDTVESESWQMRQYWIQYEYKKLGYTVHVLSNFKRKNLQVRVFYIGRHVRYHTHSPPLWI
jgi:hypothetical protein